MAGGNVPELPAEDPAGARYSPRLHVVLFRPEIPYNTGSVGRTCVAIGAKLWLVRPLGFRVDDYYLRRAGLDYWQHLVWQAVDDWSELISHLPVDRHWYFTKRGTQPYAQVHYLPGDVLVFGSESQGLPDEMLRSQPERCLRITTRPEVRSLNLSNSVAVAVYEAARQWEQVEPLE
jgi:tRNA (cytidine/uridine-2'-O-)-methyltransferase